MSQINDLLQDSQAQFRAQRNETKSLVRKWEKTGLLEGISEEYNKHNTAILLENQAKQLISEANATSTTTAEDWNGVALPLVRRIFGEISAKEFVSVQPMNLPSGLVFWMDFKYGTDKGGQGIGTTKSLFANTAKDGRAVTTSALYGDDVNTGAQSRYSLKPAELAVTLSAGKWVNASDGHTITSADNNLAGAWYFVSASDFVGNDATNALENVSATRHAASAFSGAVGAATFSAVQASAVGKLFYYKEDTTDSTKRGDFEDTNIPEMGAPAAGTDLLIPEIEVNLQQEALVAKTRKLKVKWTPEFAQDLNAYHSIDAEAELTSMLSEYISMEIDMEILGMLKNNAEFSTTHTFPTLSGGMVATDQLSTLGVTLQNVSNVIHQSTMRGGANWIVVSPKVATFIESIPGYGADTDGTTDKFAMGVSAVGSLKNRWTIYKNPYWTGNDILMGFRGTQFLETGAVFAPYIPLIMTPLVYDPTNFTPRKGVMTRYAKKVVRKDYYATVTVAGQGNVTYGEVF